MPACEKCWRDSRSADGRTGHDAYTRLLAERQPHPCTPEEQAGPDAGFCSACGRKTIHQYARDWCMACNEQRTENTNKQGRLKI